jgi:hypothetical protein
VVAESGEAMSDANEDAEREMRALEQDLEELFRRIAARTGCVVREPNFDDRRRSPQAVIRMRWAKAHSMLWIDAFRVDGESYFRWFYDSSETGESLVAAGKTLENMPGDFYSTAGFFFGAKP